MGDIYDKIEKLSPEKSKLFTRELKKRIWDRKWLEIHNMPYIRYNITRVREILYQELFKEQHKSLKPQINLQNNGHN